MVHQHAFFALMDPYANSFHKDPEWNDRRAGLRRGGYIATGNYELDNWCYSVRLAYQLWKKQTQLIISLIYFELLI